MSSYCPCRSRCPACGYATLECDIWAEWFTGRCLTCNWKPDLDIIKRLQWLGRPVEPDVVYLMGLFTMKPAVKDPGYVTWTDDEGRSYKYNGRDAPTEERSE